MNSSTNIARLLIAFGSNNKKDKPSGVSVNTAQVPQAPDAKRVTPSRKRSIAEEVGERIQVIEVQRCGQVIIKASPVKQDTSPIPEHRRIKTPFSEGDENEDYYQSIRQSFGDDNFQFDKLEGLFAQWKDDLDQPSDDMMDYNRFSLLSALNSIKNEINDQIQSKALLLLEQLQNPPNRKINAKIRETINQLDHLNYKVLSPVIDFETGLKEAQSASVKLRKLPTHKNHKPFQLDSQIRRDREDQATIPGVVESKESPNHVHPYFSSNVISEEKLADKGINPELPPWLEVYNLVDTALLMLQSDMYSLNTDINPQSIWSMDWLPKKMKLACLKQLAINECNKNSSCCFSCCRLYKPRRTAKEFFGVISQLQIDTLTQEDVIQFKLSLKNVATFLVADDRMILNKHLRFGSSISED